MTSVLYNCQQANTLRIIYERTRTNFPLNRKTFRITWNSLAFHSMSFVTYLLLFTFHLLPPEVPSLNCLYTRYCHFLSAVSSLCLYFCSCCPLQRMYLPLSSAVYELCADRGLAPMEIKYVIFFPLMRVIDNYITE